MTAMKNGLYAAVAFAAVAAGIWILGAKAFSMAVLVVTSPVTAAALWLLDGLGR